MSIIDAHCHIWRLGEDISENYAAWRAKILTEQGARCWYKSTTTWTQQDFNVTYEDCIRNMDKHGVDKSIVEGFYYRIPWSPQDKWIRIKNDYIAEAQNKYPERLIGYASVDPMGGRDAVRELERAINVLGLKGVGEFAPVYSGLALDDPALDPIYQKCEELCIKKGVYVSIHCGFNWYPWTPLEKQDPALLWHVMEKFPRLNIKVDHAGMGGTWDHALHLALAWKNVYLDFTSVRSAYPPFKIMELLRHAKSVGLLPRCIWGTDYPDVDRIDDLEMYRKFPAESNRLGNEPLLTDEDMAAFLGGNTERMLSL